jgi:hypothetical protein
MEGSAGIGMEPRDTGTHPGGDPAMDAAVTAVPWCMLTLTPTAHPVNLFRPVTAVHSTRGTAEVR